MDKKALLQQAIDCLKIQDVYLRSSNASLADDFEPKYAPDIEDLDVQYKHLVTQSSVLSLEEDSAEKSKNAVQLFRVFVTLGARWVTPTSKEDATEDDGIRAEIEAVMMAEYLMQKNPGQDALNEFALRNASYHIWPFWREYLTTQCMRMNLPKLMLPTMQVAQNIHAESNESDCE